MKPLSRNILMLGRNWLSFELMLMLFDLYKKKYINMGDSPFFIEKLKASLVNREKHCKNFSEDITEACWAFKMDPKDL